MAKPHLNNKNKKLLKNSVLSANLSDIFSSPTLTLVSLGINVTLVFLLLATFIYLQKVEAFMMLESYRHLSTGNDVRTSQVDVMTTFDHRECHNISFGKKKRVCNVSETPERLGHLGEMVNAGQRADIYKGQLLEKLRRYLVKAEHEDSQIEALKPAAHVAIVPNRNATESDEHAPRLQWDKSTEGSFLTRVVLDNGDRLRVMKSGYYYVYSNLQFNLNRTHQKELPRAVAAYMFRCAQGKEDRQQKLMMSRESSCSACCSGSRDHNVNDVTSDPVPRKVSLHMAGIFVLRSGDEITVRSSGAGLLNHSPTTTYLGMHMV